ncbi:hypothetical protein SDC9_103128 [bioreactor metagenome]|uniref:Uncharacterized protein n=1 Tax=bioreactor metagenome TaxID=1076179 RepID=A0A645ATU6_9ZZZZ
MLLHAPLVPHVAAKLLGLGAAEGHAALPGQIPRGTPGCMRLAAQSAGDKQLAPLPVKFRPQGRAAAAALHLHAGGLQREQGPGRHHGFSAGGTEIAEGSHFIFHESTSNIRFRQGSIVKLVV